MAVVVQVISNTAPRGTLTLTFASNYSQVTGASLKAKIQGGIGIPVREQQLVFNGKAVMDSDNLQRIGISNGSVVQLDRHVQGSASVAAVSPQSGVHPKGLSTGRQTAATAVAPITAATPPQGAFPIGSSRVNAAPAPPQVVTHQPAPNVPQRTPSPAVMRPMTAASIQPGLTTGGVVVIPQQHAQQIPYVNGPPPISHGPVPPVASPDVMFTLPHNREHDAYCQTAVDFMGSSGGRFYGHPAQQQGGRHAVSPMRGAQPFPFNASPELTGPFAPVFLDKSQMEAARGARYMHEPMVGHMGPVAIGNVSMTAPSVAFAPSSPTAGGEMLHFIATTGVGNSIAQPIGPNGVPIPIQPPPGMAPGVSPVRNVPPSAVAQAYGAMPASPVTLARGAESRTVAYGSYPDTCTYQSPMNKTVVPEVVIPSFDFEDGPVDFQITSNSSQAIKQQREHQQRVKREHEAIRQSRDIEFARTRKELEDVKIQSEIEISMAEREVQQKLENIERLHRKHRRAEEYIGRITHDREEERRLESEASRQLDANIAALDDHAEGARQAELDQIRAKLRRHTELQSQIAAERAQAEVVRKEQTHYIREAESALHSKVEDLLGRESWLEKELIDIEERKRAMEEMKDNGNLPIRRNRAPLQDIRNTPRGAQYAPRGMPAYDEDLDISKPSNKSWDERCWEESVMPARGRAPPQSSLHAGTWA